MTIFNSLGSNYTLPFVLKALFHWNDTDAHFKLISYLETRYEGKAILLYKGREAITLALNLTHFPKNTKIAMTGFTCFAVYKAIKDAGYIPLYIDIGEDLNFSAKNLEEKVKKDPHIKGVIIQNTLGYPCDIEHIEKVCKKYKIILIEDLAHSIGTKYKNQKEAGRVGDFTILSFSQDKIIDGISGGALIIRNPQFKTITVPQLKKVPYGRQLIDRCYPFFTYIIRNTYSIGLGKLIHEIVKRGKLLSNPMGNQKNGGFHTLPNWYCHLILFSFRNLENNLHHRRTLATLYAHSLDPRIIPQKLTPFLLSATHLRFPLFIKKRDALITYLKKQGIYISDIWYDSPIGPKKYMHLTHYKHQCEQAERIALSIVNIPTHQNISIQKAREIIKQIHQWFQLL